MKPPLTLQFCFLLPFLCCCIVFPGAAAEVDEVSALLSVKSSLIDPLGHLRDWSAPPATPHCGWKGVRCSRAGSVESLDLSQLNISGAIGPGLDGLPNLVSLNFRGNSFSSLPEILPPLPLLEVFDVSSNLFVGQFPAGFGGLPSLKYVNASGNNFKGSLPDSLGNATSLENLDLRGNYFEGQIPVSYKSLKKLKLLGLSGNNLNGKLPYEIGELTALEILIIGYNNFDGPIPPELGNLANLRYLDMAVGNLTGAVPPELGKLQSLTTMYLYRNSLEGVIPKEVGNMSSLAFLDLSENQISGSIPTELAGLRNLRLLNLMGNKLTGQIPPSLGDLNHLEAITLWNNSLTGTLPANLGKNSALQWLDVSTNQLSGPIPGGLCSGRNLTKLILFNNGFSGPMPESLTSCSSLVRVRMHNNRINATIPAGLGKLPKLERLELAGNSLDGEIPDDISSSTSLSFIDVSNNRLQSSLPANIFSIPTLQTFLASNNEFSGDVPDQFQDSPSLAMLDLSHNRLSGSIPASLASCTKLVNLDLSNNNFTGEIPMSFAIMPTLSVLDLSNNQLNGSIPVNLGDSPALEAVNLSNNRLSGQVPANGIFRTINPYDLSGNSGLCGGILPKCRGGLGSDSWPGSKRPPIKHLVVGWVTGLSTVLAIALVLVGAIWIYQNWYSEAMAWFHDRFKQETAEEWPWRLTAYQRLNFTASEILACIKESSVLGKGSTGVVYKAETARGTVAVKKLFGAAQGGIEAEVALLGRLRHRNIVRLLGSLHNEAEAMLVYEYMPSGSLWDALHGKRAVLVDWLSRYSVAVGVAQGLAYLHHDCYPSVIHRDVKTKNILLDASLDARIADFGLARIMARKNETVSAVAGSYGYIAPEYGYTLKVDQKSDIYSFGVVLMELLTGRRPVEAEFGEGQDIVGWVRERLRTDGKAVEDVLDASVGARCQHVQEEMMLVLRIAVLCTARMPKDRPSMRDVLTMLGEAKPRRKSSSTSGASTAAGPAASSKDKPVFSASPESDCV